MITVSCSMKENYVDISHNDLKRDDTLTEIASIVCVLIDEFNITLSEFCSFAMVSDRLSDSFEGLIHHGQNKQNE